MDGHPGEQLLPQHTHVRGAVHCHLGGRQNRETLLFLAEKRPHTVTLGDYLTFVTTLLLVEAKHGQPPNLLGAGVHQPEGVYVTEHDVLSVLFIPSPVLTESHPFFLTIFSKRRGFLAAQRKGIPSLLLQMSWMD
jgi:hypothetical protein